MTDLVDFHSTHVDPKELVVSTSFFQHLVSEEALSKCPYTRMYLLICQYTNEKVKGQAGGPSVAQFLEPNPDHEPVQEARLSGEP